MQRSEPGSYAHKKAYESGNIPVVDRLIKSGVSATDAINRTCGDVYSYNEAMAIHGLRAVAPD